MKPKIHIIDDDEGIRDALVWLLDSRGITSCPWESGEAFLENFTRTPPSTSEPSCFLIDIRMTGMSGLILFDRLCELGNNVPVIFLTGHGDIPMAVAALKKGAFDFFEKPFNDNELADRVLHALEIDKKRLEQQLTHESLTERERQVMSLILAGKQNKVIAEELAITMRTVEVHRSRIFEKMGVRSAVELAQKLTPKIKL